MKTLLFILVSFSASAQTVIEYRLFNEKWYGIDSAGVFHHIEGVNYGRQPLPDPIVNYTPSANRTPEQLEKFREDVIIKPSQIAEYKYHNQKLYGIDREGNYVKLPQIKYGKEPMPAPLSNYTPPANAQPKPQEINFNHAKRVNKAGKLFITSGVLLLASGVTSAVAITEDVPELAYVSVGMSTVAVVATIAAGVQLLHFRFPKSDLSVSAGQIKLQF